MARRCLAKFAPGGRRVGRPISLCVRCFGGDRILDIEATETRLKKILQVGSTTITLFSIWLLTGVAFTVAIVAGRAWLYWHTPLMPNAGNVLAILLGAVFGGFSARFASSMFNSRFGERDPIIGAAVLARCVSYTAFPYILTLFRVWSTE
jgi:hypothetical protein